LLGRAFLRRGCQDLGALDQGNGRRTTTQLGAGKKKRGKSLEMAVGTRKRGKEGRK